MVSTRTGELYVWGHVLAIPGSAEGNQALVTQIWILRSRVTELNYLLSDLGLIILLLSFNLFMEITPPTYSGGLFLKKLNKRAQQDSPGTE